MTKDRVVATLEEIARLLELSDDNPFKARAYRNAARAVAGIAGNLARPNSFKDIPGIGTATAAKITTLLNTGSLPYLDELRASLPTGLAEIATLKGVGAKRARQLIESLDVHSVTELEHACTENRLLALDGFGERSQSRVLDAIRQAEQAQADVRFDRALLATSPLLDALRASVAVTSADLAGGLRRRLETVAQVDLVVATDAPDTVALLAEASLGSVTTTPQRIAGHLANGLPVVIHLTHRRDYARVLRQNTGSTEHLAELVTHARTCGLTLDDDGVLYTADHRLVAHSTEADFYDILGLDEIPPELREGRGEIAVAADHNLPNLIELTQLRGAIHNHTNWSDGRNTLEEMVAAARALGWSYFGVSDHSVSARYAHGLDADRLRAQHAQIAALNRQSSDGFRILHGAEVDILADGSLDYDHATRSELDFVIASLHGRFDLKRDEQTRRVLRALDDPTTMVLGHPTGRLLRGRAGADLDLDAVIDACAQRGVAIEINASPHRLELDWRYLRRASERGVKLFINPDAHRVTDLQNVALGVGIARKGWLTQDDIVNTRDVDSVLAFFAERRDRAKRVS